MKSIPIVCSAVTLVMCTADVHADTEKLAVDKSVGATRRAGALGAALVPGLLVHGSGHWVLGDKRTARKLRRMEMVGLLLAGIGGTAAGLSGMDENLAMFYVPLLVAGGTTFAGSFLADLVGVAAHGATSDGSATAPGWGDGSFAHTSLGYRHIHHPGIDVRHVARAAGGFRAGRISVAVTGEMGAAGAYHGQGLALRYRTNMTPLAMSRLDIGMDVAHHRLRDDGLSSVPGSVWAEMTWDLRKLAPSVPGAYGRGRFGLGAELVNYDDVPGIDDDMVPLLVAEAGIGFRLGRTDWEISYNHRKDGFPGGSFLGRLPGMLGSIGAASRLRLGRGWSAVGEARWGTGVSSWLAIEKGW